MNRSGARVSSISLFIYLYYVDEEDGRRAPRTTSRYTGDQIKRERDTHTAVVDTLDDVLLHRSRGPPSNAIPEKDAIRPIERRYIV